MSRSPSAQSLLEMVGVVPLLVAERLVGHDVLAEMLDDGLAVTTQPDGEPRMFVESRPHGRPTSGLGRLDVIRAIAERLDDEAMAELAPSVSLDLAQALADAGEARPGLFELAARHALASGAPDTARALASASLAADPTRTVAAHLLAMSLEARGSHGAATAVNVGGSADDAGWLGRWTSNLFMSTGIVADATHAADDHNEILANRVWIEAIDGRVDVVAQSVRSVLDDPRSSAQAVVWACVGGSLPAALGGHADVAHRLLQHAASIAAFGHDELTPFAELQVALAGFLVDVRTGSVETAERTATRMIDSADAPYVRSVWLAVGGLSARERGAYSDAISRFEEGLGAFEDVPFGLGTWARSELAVCEAMVGRPTEPITTGSHGLFESCLHRNNAWIAAATGRLGDAQLHLRRAIDVAIDRGQVAHHALAIIDVARFGRQQLAAELVRSLPDRDAPIVDVCVGGVSALATRSLDDLIQWHRRARLHGIEPFASELAATALERAAGTSPTESARTELLTSVIAIRSPMLTEVSIQRPTITVREREVAELAGRSIPSREIGDVLGISVRTVDNLLGRVYSKAGISGRAELEALVAPTRSPTPAPW